MTNGYDYERSERAHLSSDEDPALTLKPMYRTRRSVTWIQRPTYKVIINLTGSAEIATLFW